MTSRLFRRSEPLYKFGLLLVALMVSLRAYSANELTNEVAENCAQAQVELERQAQTLESLRNQHSLLNELLSGQLRAEFALSEALGTPLDSEYKVDAQRVKLNINEATQPNSNPEAPVLFQPCPDLGQTWLAQERQLQSLKQEINRQQRSLLEQPRAVRLALMRTLNQWQIIYQLESEVQALAKGPNSPDSNLIEGIDNWIEIWRNAARIWLAQLLSSSQGAQVSNVVWRNMLHSPTQNEAIPWPSLTDSSDGLSADTWLNWQNQLESAQIAIFREASRWRNKKIWELSWGELMSEIAKPDFFVEQLSAEVRAAPLNLSDNISRPFIRDYRKSVIDNRRGEQLSSWFLQALALVMLMSGLLKIASTAPLYMSRWQNRLQQSLEQPKLKQVCAATFWFAKPNAPWVIVLLGSNILAYFTPEGWYILRWVGPIGIVYAAYRAVRVILEWAISRTFTRSEQFVPTHTAQLQAKDIRSVSWVVVACLVAWLLVKGTGGGYLLHIISVLDLIIFWLALLWLLRRYREGVARFFLFVAGKSRTVDIAQVKRWWLISFWPLLFIIAHVIDVIASLNQRLMIFDTYRLLSVKLMRIRLAAESKEKEEADKETAAEEELPDQTYGEWMLRKEEAPWIDVIGLDKIIAPLQNWSNTNPDDNVLLIVGDQGSGKSTLVNKLTQNWEETPISVLKIPPKTTVPEAVFALLANHLGNKEITNVAELVKHDETTERQVIVLEDAHNLFLSEVGKLDGYRAINQCLNAHLKNIFWVVVMHSQSWTYLSCVFNRELRFSNIFQMPRWSPADIRKLILSRHQGSRRRLKYNELLLSATAGSESSSIRAANSRIFNILWEQSNGNPKVAIHLWLNAAKTKDRIVEVGVPEKPQSAPLKSMKDDFCFIFAAISSHYALDSEEIIGVTHYPESIVRHALKQGSYNGILLRDDTKRYRIHPLWQGTLFSFLANKNMLWTL